MSTALHFLFAFVILVFATGPAGARTLSCPGGVLFEQGSDWSHDDGYNAFEQDIGGDYDENARQAEWNRLNEDEGQSVLIHCYMNKINRDKTDVWLPREFKRCIAKGNDLTCLSDSIACVGYVGNVTIEGIRKGQFHRLLKPTLEPKVGKKKVWEKFERGEDESLTANCYPEDETTHGDYQTMMLPPNVKNCRFENRRFICLLQPEK